MSRSSAVAIFPFFILAAVLLAAAPFVGPFDAWHGFFPSDQGRSIVFRLRLPRAVVAFAVGGILATSGLVCQVLLRNALATPTTLGVSGGAALGASLAIATGWSLSMINGPLVAAVLGAAITSVALFGLIGFSRRVCSEQIVLIGILVNYLMSSLILFVQFIADPAELSRIVVWLIGAVRPTSWGEASFLSAVSVWLLVVLMGRAGALNALALGRDPAESRGVNVSALERSLLGATSVGIGAAVASCGGIGFVGILEPQVCRRVLGADFRLLIPAVFLLGGSVVVGADLLGRVLFPPLEIPAGVLTAIIEIPFGLFLLVRRKK